MTSGEARPSTIATPPPSGLAAAWIFLPPGLSIRPKRGAIRIIASVASHAMMKLVTPRPRMGRIMRCEEGYLRGARRETSARSRSTGYQPMPVCPRVEARAGSPCYGRKKSLRGGGEGSGFDNPRRHAHRRHICWHIMNHHRSGADDASIADADALNN